MHLEPRIHLLTQLRYPSITLLALALALLSLSACARQQDSSPATASRLTIELLPPETDAGSLSVRLTGSDGRPVTDAQVSLEGNMNHAGMVPVVAAAVADDADGSADGVYVVPFEFTMFGDWIVTVSAVTGDETVTQDFDLSVDAEGVHLSDP